MPDSKKIRICLIEDQSLLMPIIFSMVRHIVPVAEFYLCSSISSIRHSCINIDAIDVYIVSLNVSVAERIDEYLKFRGENYFSKFIVLTSSDSSSKIHSPSGCDFLIGKNKKGKEIYADLANFFKEKFDQIEIQVPAFLTISKRKRQLLVMLSMGFSNNAIASELGLSVHSVKVQLSRLFQSLQVSNRLEAIHYGRAHGLLF